MRRGELERELDARAAQRDLRRLPLGMKPVLRTQVPITIARATSSGRSCASCTAISDPIEGPTSATGGSQTASISAAQSAACRSIPHGGGALDRVAPTPRAS
jgi:hypothetical protein